MKSGSFLSSLSKHDLNRLRAVIQKVHSSYFPLDAKFDRNKEADKVIEALGQEVVEAQLKKMVDSGHTEKKLYIGDVSNPVSKGSNAS